MGVYTTDHSASVLQTHGWRTLANSAAYIIPYIKPNMKVLDIGCGPGSITVDFARHVPQGHVTGVDYVSDPFEKARSLASSEGITNVDFQVADIHSLDFPDNTFDIVHVHQVLQHIADPIQALREMRRVAKADGGIVAAREASVYDFFPDNEKLAAFWAVMQGMAKQKGGNLNCGRCIHAWAQEAGFSQDKIKKSVGTWCFSTPEEREYFGGSMEARAKSSGFSKNAIEGGYATREELDRMAEGWREWVENEKGWFGMIHAEIVCFK